MPAYERNPDSFGSLRDQVVVLTGGAGAVGEQIVRLLYRAGAHVFFGDINEDGSKKVIAALRSELPSASNSLVSIRFDARKYADNIALFKQAYGAHGRVDHAFAIAGITESLNWFDETLDLDSIQVAPPTTLVDVNLTGVLYFTRIAAVYLRQGNPEGLRDKSICLMGSIASFKEQAGLFVYGAAKHGMMGLFRATRKPLFQKHHIRVNMVNPSHINNAMGSAVHKLWVDHGVPVNEPSEVAEHVLTLAATPLKQDGTAATNLAIYVEGGLGWDIEEDLDNTDHLWMGENMSRNSATIEKALGLGVNWVSSR